MKIASTFLLLTIVGQSQPPRVYSEHDQGITAPRALEKAAPEYSDEARLARLEGTVIVTLVVEQDATLRDVHVSRSLGLGLDEKAIDAVMQWHFTAAMKDDQPVACLTRVEVNFRMLTARSDWYLTRTDFETPRSVARPVVLGAEFPAEIGTGETATAVISFDIDGQGSATGVRVDFISDEKWGPQLIAAMRSWKFQPSANPVHATFGFAAGQIPTAPSQLF